MIPVTPSSEDKSEYMLHKRRHKNNKQVIGKVLKRPNE